MSGHFSYLLNDFNRTVREGTLQTGYVSEFLDNNDPHCVFYCGKQSITSL